MKKVLITDKVHDLLISGLKDLGYHVDYEPSITRQEVSNIIHDYHGIVINSKIKMDGDMIDRGSALRWIARLGSGLEIIDLSYASTKEIEVINSPEGNRNAVAEHTLGMILCWCNNIIRADREIRELQWNREKNRGIELSGKTIGVIGYGQMGSAFVSLISSWNLNVLVYDKYKTLSFKNQKNIKAVSLADILNEADFISLHLPYTSETHHFVDTDFIDRCKMNAVIINTSRGAIIHTAALIDALDKAKLKGACLDVFENEKPDTYTLQERELYLRLFEMDQVVLSPHIAGWTKESLFKIADTIVNKVKCLNERDK